jgi:hypothetical protein
MVAFSSTTKEQRIPNGIAQVVSAPHRSTFHGRENPTTGHPFAHKRRPQNHMEVTIMRKLIPVLGPILAALLSAIPVVGPMLAAVVA